MTKSTHGFKTCYWKMSVMLTACQCYWHYFFTEWNSIFDRYLWLKYQFWFPPTPPTHSHNTDEVRGQPDTGYLVIRVQCWVQNFVREITVQKSTKGQPVIPTAAEVCDVHSLHKTLFSQLQLKSQMLKSSLLIFAVWINMSKNQWRPYSFRKFAETVPHWVHYII